MPCKINAQYSVSDSFGRFRTGGVESDVGNRMGNLAGYPLSCAGNEDGEVAAVDQGEGHRSFLRPAAYNSLSVPFQYQTSPHMA